MRLLALLFAVLSFSLPLPALAQRSPVVVEFYTSQGCSACPPADAFFAELAETPGVLALAFHVTYWNYQGWPDSFGKTEHDDRQRAYAKVAKQRSLYTPQMIVQGVDRAVGSDAATIVSAVAAHSEQPESVKIVLGRQDGMLTIRLAPTGLAPTGPSDVLVVGFLPSQTVEIGEGENAGRTIEYRNIVTEWRTVARWDGMTEWEFATEAPHADRIAVIVQRERKGPILSAALLE